MEMSKRGLTVLIVLLSLAFGAAAVWGLKAQSVDASPSGGGSGSTSASASPSGSASTPTGTPAADGELDGVWAAKDTSNAPIELAAPATLTFKDGKVTAKTGCNVITGNAEVGEDGTLTTSDLSNPTVTCPPPLAAQQAWIMAMLEASPQTAVDGDNLTLSWTEDADYTLGLERDSAS